MDLSSGFRNICTATTLGFRCSKDLGFTDGRTNFKHAVGCNILTFIFPIFNLNKHKQRCFCCKTFSLLDFYRRVLMFLGWAISSVGPNETFDNCVDIRNIYSRTWNEWHRLLQYYWPVQHFPVNSVVMLHHKTPNVSCCSPSNDIATWCYPWWVGPESQKYRIYGNVYFYP